MHIYNLLIPSTVYPIHSPNTKAHYINSYAKTSGIIKINNPLFLIVDWSETYNFNMTPV